MSAADDDAQQIASPEASETPDASVNPQAEDSAPLPELAVIGAAAEDEAGAKADGSAKNASEKPLSARDRLTSRTREARPRKKRGPLIAAILLLLLVLGALGAAVGGLAYLRWYANDDALDFQGTWYVAGTETPIEITADSIRLTESVSYRYKLNTWDKTITLTLGNMIGHGSYRFSLDRSQLVIFDGQADPTAILEADVRWLVQALYDDLKEEPNDVTTDIRRNRTLLTREPNTFPIGISNQPTETSATDSSAEQAEGPQTVWSAEEWLNRSEEDGEGGSSDDASSGTSTISNANDVASLLEGINDLPGSTAPDATAPSDEAAPESTAS